MNDTKSLLDASSCNHQLTNLDRLQGVIRLPIQLSKSVRRGCSGSFHTLPMQHPPVGRDFHATLDEVITEYGGLMQLY